jgi:hypothetical protein
MNTVIDNATYKKDYQSKQGSLSFPDELWDCGFYVDKKKLRKAITLPKGARILKVLITTESSPEFENKVNEQIVYKTPMSVSSKHPKAEEGNYGYVARNPVGKAWIVISTPKVKKTEN